MHFPAQSHVESEAVAYPVIVLKIEVEFLLGRYVEWRVLILAVTACRAQEEVRIGVAGIGLGPVVGAGGRVIDGRCQVGKSDLVRRTVGEIGESFEADAGAKRRLMFAPDFSHVF